MNGTIVRGLATNYVELSHGKSRYFDAGEGPAVILVHGAGFVSGGHSWLPILPELAKRYRVIAPDAVGWGPGDQLDQPYSFAYLVDFLRELQDALGLGRTHVVGHSMGGWLGALLAYESPQRVDRLVIIAGGGLATRPLHPMVHFKAPTRPEIESRIRSLGLAEEETTAICDELEQLAKDEIRVERFRGIMNHMSDGETRHRYNLARRLPQIYNKTLVLWGTEDEVNRYELGERTAQLMPNCRLETFQAAGHGLVAERPDEVIDAISSFLPAS